ncbi:Polyubiquitin 9 [Platanthera zijinensis]|uniref:Polyubiquitin 9 n=1 Tax=Platanthera zijinensis TaxID=2320716 RepID=A0AAP0BN87_9ASPA
MADESSLEGTSSNQVNSDSSDSAIRINVKTLDSQIYSFNVKKNISVPALKEEIVRTIGVPLEQQRLIYRGKVLKDDQLLSHHSVEDGDTLHLVVRPQAQAQTTPSIVNPDTSRTSSQANDSSSSSQQQPRVGQVAHSVFLGTVNIGDRQGEAIPFDLSQIVPAVLNLLGAPNFGAAGGPNLVPVVSASNQASSGTGTQTSQSTSQTQSGNPANGGFIFPNQQFSQMPSMRNVISDALTTLLEFIDRMQGVLQSSDNSLNNDQNQPHSATSSLDARGLPTTETLRSVLERTQVLLRDNAVAALSHLSTRLQREEGSSDPLLRSQIQTEAMQLGVAMQHLGAMFLELGRVTMTLRMGQTQAESSVYAGPAVYISPAGPNPIMVQPFPFQSSSLFGSSPLLFSEMLGRGAPGDSSSNMNIHAGPAEAIHGEHANAEQTTSNRTGLSDSISTSGLPSREMASGLQARVAPQSGGQVLSVTYPVHVRVQQPVIIRSGNQVVSTIISRDVQLHEPTSVPLPSLGSDSLPVIVAEVTARSPTGFNGNARVQSSSIQSSAINGSQGSDNSDRQSDMSNSTLHPPEVYSGVTHTTELNVERTSALGSDCQPQNALSRPENSVLSSPEDLLSGKDVYDGSKKVLGAESSKQNCLGEDLVSDFTVSRKVEQHIQLKDDQSSSMDACRSFEEPLATNSTSSSANFQPGLSDKYFKGETNSLELGQSPSSNKTVECQMPTPLGLGVGGLQSKKRSKPIKSKGSSDAQAKASSSDHSQQSQTSHVDGENANESSNQFPSLISQFMNSMPSGGQAPSGHMDFAGMMSNAIQSSGFNNLLSGVASHSRVPTGDLRSMLEQCVQNPAVQNTFSQLVQHVGQSGDQMSNTGQGRFDFKGMIQQMLPAVSQALGSSSASSAAAMDIQSEPDSKDVLTCADESLNDRDYQVDLGQALERIEQNDDPKGIFGALLKVSGGLCGEQTLYQDIVELGDDEELASEFTEILRQDIRRRLAKESKSDDKS